MKLPKSSIYLLRAISVSYDHCVNMSYSGLKSGIILSESNRKSCIEKFKSYQFPKVQKPVPEAAVLIPLCIHNGELGLLYTLRSMKLTTNRGEVCFPGGKRDKEDTDLVETALRETWEELKIAKDKIDVWTKGNVIGKTTVNIIPVLAYIGEVVIENLDINPDEVEEAFVISLYKLCDPELFYCTRFRGFTLPNYLGGKHRVWGFTGFLTHIVLESLIPNIYKNELCITQYPKTKDSNISNTEVRSNLDYQNDTLSKI